MITNKQVTIGGVVILAIAAALVFLGAGSFTAFGSAPSGLMSIIATSSNPVVGTTVLTLFATSSCNARIITTYANPVMLTFSDYAGQTPTATFGHLQSASTTVVYDSGIYGCGLVKAYGYTATTAITVSETR